MNVEHFIWLDEVEEKISHKHNIEPREAEEAFFHNPHFRFVEKGHRRGEDVYSVQSKLESGRFVIVFFVFKRKTNEALILSARAMTQKERKLYEKHVKD